VFSLSVYIVYETSPLCITEKNFLESKSCYLAPASLKLVIFLPDVTEIFYLLLLTILCQGDTIKQVM
jgi:hypothetical protein